MTHHSEPAREAVARLREHLTKEACCKQATAAAIAVRAMGWLDEANERKKQNRTDGAIRAAMRQAADFQLYAAKLHEEVDMFMSGILPASPAPAASGGLEASKLDRWRRILAAAKEVGCDKVQFTIADAEDVLAALAVPAATGGEAVAWACEADIKALTDEGADVSLARTALPQYGMKTPLYTHPAPSETGASLGVKALEWVKDGSVWFAHGGFGQGYQIYTHGADGVHRVMFSWSTKLWDLQASTLDEAKAAAQSDFETRIRAALEGRADG